MPGKIEKYSGKEWFVLYFQPGMTSSSVSIKEHNLSKPASQITSSRVYCSSQSTQVIPSCSIPQAVFGNSSLSNRYFFGGRVGVFLLITNPVNSGTTYYF